MTKSCTRTSSGEPFGRHSRPAFLKSPTSSFFLVSTEIAGSPAASASVSEFHCAVHAYNTLWRSSLPVSNAPVSNAPMGNQVDYNRVIPLRSGGQKRRKAGGADDKGAARGAWHDRAGLRLVAENAGPSPTRTDRAPWLAVVEQPARSIARAALVCGRSPIRLRVDNDGDAA